MKNRKKAFTLIEIIIVIAIISILAVITLPKIKYYIIEARNTGVDKNKNLLMSLASSEYEKQFDSSIDDTDRVQKTYDNLAIKDDIKNMKSPFNKTKLGIGLITGKTYIDSGKAGYVFTEKPDTSTIPSDIVWVYISNNEVTYGVGGSKSLSENIPPEPVIDPNIPVYDKSKLQSNYYVALMDDSNYYLYTWSGSFKIWYDTPVKRLKGDGGSTKLYYFNISRGDSITYGSNYTYFDATGFYANKIADSNYQFYKDSNFSIPYIVGVD